MQPIYCTQCQAGNSRAPQSALQDLRSKNERLRLAGEAARECSVRLEAECARLRREGAQLAAASVSRGPPCYEASQTALAELQACLPPISNRLRPALALLCSILQAERSAEADAVVAALEARAARLAGELEEAALAAEVLRAKGRRYDEAAERAQRAVRRLWGVSCVHARPCMWCLCWAVRDPRSAGPLSYSGDA